MSGKKQAKSQQPSLFGAAGDATHADSPLLAPARTHTEAQLLGFQELVLKALQGAAEAGGTAGRTRFAKLVQHTGEGDSVRDNCGGATIHLRVDGRSALGRVLRQLMRDGPPWLIVTRERGRGYCVGFHYGFVCRERSPMVAAAHAALEVIQQELGVEGWVQDYLS